MDGIIKQRVKELDEMIGYSFNILMGLSALISGTLIITLYGCFLRCCNCIDTAVPKIQPHASRIPVIAEHQEHKHHEQVEFVEVCPKIWCFASYKMEKII